MTKTAEELRAVANKGSITREAQCLLRKGANELDQAAAELDRLREQRGRCERHKNMPGPSLYHDCCESERLRELYREQAAELDRLRAELKMSQTALVLAHACATLRDDGACGGCMVSEAISRIEQALEHPQ